MPEIFYKKDLFARLHARRNFVSEEEFEDLYDCMVKFIENEALNGTAPAIALPNFSNLYLTKYRVLMKMKHDKSESTKERYENIKYQASLLPKSTNKNLLLSTPLHNIFRLCYKKTLEEIEQIQNEHYKDNQK